MKTPNGSAHRIGPSLPEIRKKHRSGKLQRRILAAFLASLVIMGVAYMLLPSLHDDLADSSWQPHWQPTSLEGSVTALNSDGTPLTVKINTRLPDGTRILSGPKSEIDLSAPGIGALKLDENSELIIVPPASDEKTNAATLELKKGRIFPKLPKLEPGRELKLRTAGVQVVVRGTEFFVEAKGEDTLVAVRSGTVGVTLEGPDGPWIKDIPAGQMAKMNPKTGGTTEEIGDQERRLFSKLDRIIEITNVSGKPPMEQWISLLPSDSSEFGAWTVSTKESPPDPEVIAGKVSVRTTGKNQTISLQHPLEPAKDIVFKMQYVWGQDDEAVNIRLVTTDQEKLSCWSRGGGWWGMQKQAIQPPRLNLTTGYNPGTHAGTGADSDGYITLSVAKLGRSLAFYAGGALIVEAQIDKDAAIESVEVSFTQLHDGTNDTQFKNMQVYYPDTSSGPNGERQEADYWRCARAIGHAETHEARLAALRQVFRVQYRRDEHLLKLALAFESEGRLQLAGSTYNLLSRPLQPGDSRPEEHIRSMAIGRLGQILERDLDQALNSDSPPKTLIPLGTSWKFFEYGKPLPPEWNTSWFDDSDWPEGPAPLGFGKEKTIVTTLNYGDNPKQKAISYHFRRAFKCENVGDIKNLVLQFRSGHPATGAVFYLNGHELDRYKMPRSKINVDTKATLVVGGGKTDRITLLLPADWLLPGSNVLAVSEHLQSSGTAEMAFDLQLMGTKKILQTPTEEIGVDEATWKRAKAR